jgi:predicted porin
VGIGAAILRFDNATPNLATWGDSSTVSSAGLPGVSAINIGYRTARAQQRIAVAGGYEATSNLGFSFTYANTQFVPGAGSTFTDTAIFNSYGLVAHYRVTPSFSVAGGYSYVAASAANRIQKAATYNELTLSQLYSLSKRTSFYAVEGFTKAGGQTLAAGTGQVSIPAVAVVGNTNNSSPSSTNKQFAVAIGLVTRF